MRIKRTFTCGELRSKDVGKKVSLSGWVHSKRLHGGLIFVDLRDRYGITQLVFKPEVGEEVFERAKRFHHEDVISVSGTVRLRPKGYKNPKLATGDVEVHISDLEVLNESVPLPFMIEEETTAFEDLRLKYRYLDLRRPPLQRAIILMHHIRQAVRSYLSSNGFLEIETPALMKSTPEGARDFLVPSRKHKGKFYALPQSPQTYKQVLMIAGFDRYFQIAHCFRDEDLRADRQPEFSQIDIEASFVDEEDIYSLIEGMFEYVFKETLGVELKRPFPRMAYKDALSRFGTDKPDTRFGMEIVDITAVVRNSGFGVFRGAVESGGVVRGINLPGCGSFSRRQTDNLIDEARSLGAKGLVLLRSASGGFSSSVAKFLTEEEIRGIRDTLSSSDGDLVAIVADKEDVACRVLGELRLRMAKRLGLVPQNSFNFLWIVDCPMFEYSEEEGKIVASHHPFTSPKPEHMEFLESDPLHVLSRSYDLVLNGAELGSGSIRIHRPEVQRRVFRVLGLSDEEMDEKFGFLLRAFQFGAPPHGGIALGLERIAAIMAGRSSIRDVIAFPKTTSAYALMEDAPSTVNDEQLNELGIRLVEEEE
ncbi:aspartate--tRNA ligase [bacterium]|nr:aspartate--tRNA ligase [bacterium]